MAAFSTSFLAVLVILGIMAFTGLLCCVLHIIMEWKKIKFIQPWNGPDRPSPSRRAIHKRAEIVRLTPVNSKHDQIGTPLPPKTPQRSAKSVLPMKPTVNSNLAAGKGHSKLVTSKRTTPVAGIQKPPVSKHKPKVGETKIQIPEVVVEDLS